MLCRLFLSSLFAVAACSSTVRGTLRLVTGEETDTFSRAPAPVKLEVDSVDASGKKSTLAIAALPASSIDLGSYNRNTVGTLQVTGTNSDGARLVFGQSIPLLFGGLDGITVPVFVQRTGEFGRLPKPLSDARHAPLLAVFSGRYLVACAGDDPSLSRATQLYDFAFFTPIRAATPLPRTPKSIVFVGTAAWLIDDSGATGFDFAGNTSFDVTPPAGASFGDIAGGATVFATDGSQYIVGATRTSGIPTKIALAFDPKGAPSWVTLSGPRLGAAATWVDGRGLVVLGGSNNLPGVEIVSPGTAAGVALSYPADASMGSGAATLDGQRVLLAGGVTPAGEDPGVRVVDLTCNSQCTSTLWAALPVPLPLAPAQVFASDPANALLVGDDPSGTTVVYGLTATAVRPIATKVTHVGARAIVSPVGSVVLFGGASEIESFAP